MRFVIMTLLFLVLAGFPAFAEEPLSFDSRITECINRWVAFPDFSDKTKYLAGFVYVDEQAGFTFHMSGKFEIDDSGRFVKVPDEGIDQETMYKTRLENNGAAAILPEEAVARLGLPEKPDWLKLYDDGSNSPYHRTRVGFWMNRMGDSKGALPYLESAYREAPETEGLAVELGFAYNASGKHDNAKAVLENALKRDPGNALLGMGLAMANMGSGDHEKAIDLYLETIPRCSEEEMDIQSEMAMMLSHLYWISGQEDERRKWLSFAKTWAPEGSPAYKALERQKQLFDSEESE